MGGASLSRRRRRMDALVLLAADARPVRRALPRVGRARAHAVGVALSRHRPVPERSAGRLRRGLLPARRQARLLDRHASSPTRTGSPSSCRSCSAPSSSGRPRARAHARRTRRRRRRGRAALPLSLRLGPHRRARRARVRLSADDLVPPLHRREARARRARHPVRADACSTRRRSSFARRRMARRFCGRGSSTVAGCAGFGVCAAGLRRAGTDGAARRSAHRPSDPAVGAGDAAAARHRRHLAAAAGCRRHAARRCAPACTTTTASSAGCTAKLAWRENGTDAVVRRRRARPAPAPSLAYDSPRCPSSSRRCSSARWSRSSRRRWFPYRLYIPERHVAVRLAAAADLRLPAARLSRLLHADAARGPACSRRCSSAALELGFYGDGFSRDINVHNWSARDDATVQLRRDAAQGRA